MASRSNGPDGKPAMQTITQQVIAQGPTASQEIIKELGTNGGGFFNANSAHPFENPTPFTNFLEMFCIFAIPSAFTFTLGKMTGSPRHGWAVWSAMALLFFAGVTVTAYWAEARGNPLLTCGCSAWLAAFLFRGARRRQSRRQGSSLRRRQLCAVRHRYHRHQLRRGQLHA